MTVFTFLSCTSAQSTVGALGKNVGELPSRCTCISYLQLGIVKGLNSWALIHWTPCCLILATTILETLVYLSPLCWYGNYFYTTCLKRNPDKDGMICILILVFIHEVHFCPLVIDLFAAVEWHKFYMCEVILFLVIEHLLPLYTFFRTGCRLRKCLLEFQMVQLWFEDYCLLWVLLFSLLLLVKARCNITLS